MFLPHSSVLLNIRYNNEPFIKSVEMFMSSQLKSQDENFLLAIVPASFSLRGQKLGHVSRKFAKCLENK